jgi:sec-independent protein translocase protein TatA
MPGGWEWLIIIGVLLLLFGAKRLPDMARSVGQSARVFKGEMKGLKDDDGRSATSPGSTARAGDRPATSSAAPADRAPLPPVDGQVNGAPGQPSAEPVRPDAEVAGGGASPRAPASEERMPPGSRPFGAER